MKPVVRRSIESQDGTRCVDLFEADGVFGFVECRRDPEDSFGWRPTGDRVTGFGSEAQAAAAASERIVWMAEALS